jgi:hypothetical protein
MPIGQRDPLRDGGQAHVAGAAADEEDVQALVGLRSSNATRPCAALLEVRLQRPREGRERLAVVGVGHLQPERGEARAPGADRLRDGRDAVGLRQVGEHLAHANHLAREHQPRERQCWPSSAPIASWCAWNKAKLLSGRAFTKPSTPIPPRPP